MGVFAKSGAYVQLRHFCLGYAAHLERLEWFQSRHSIAHHSVEQWLCDLDRSAVGVIEFARLWRQSWAKRRWALRTNCFLSLRKSSKRNSLHRLGSYWGYLRGNSSRCSSLFWVLIFIFLCLYLNIKLFVHRFCYFQFCIFNFVFLECIFLIDI